MQCTYFDAYRGGDVVQQRLIDNGYDVQGSTPEEFRKLIDSDVAMYSKVIRDAKIRGD